MSLSFGRYFPMSLSFFYVGCFIIEESLLELVRCATDLYIFMLFMSCNI